MEIVAFPNNWANDLAYEKLLSGILICILESWPEIAKPESDEGEDEVTIRLFGKMKFHKAMRHSPFRLYMHTPIVEGGGDTITGIPDLTVESNAGFSQDEFINIECKRLRRKDPSNDCRSGNSEYIDGGGQGMTAFTTGRYPSPCGEAIMIGYILCPCADSVSSLAGAIDTQASLIRLAQTAPGLRPSKVVPSKSDEVKESLHFPDPCTKLTRISHVFLDYQLCRGAAKQFVSKKGSTKKGSTKKGSTKKGSTKKSGMKKGGSKKSSGPKNVDS